MERNEVSIHEIKVYLALVGHPERWLTNREIAQMAGIPDRTVRQHTLRLVKAGILDQAEVFPAYRYRHAAKADKRNGSHVRCLEAAIDVFGLRSPS